MSTTPRMFFAVLVLSGSVGPAAQTPPVLQQCPTGQELEEIGATQNFERSVTHYVVLHQFLEAMVPPLRVTPDVGQIQAAVKALGTRIRSARAAARQGDLITPEVAQMFKRRIAACLTPAEWQAVFDERGRDEEGAPVDPPPLHVNMDWPAGVPFDFVPPQLLRSLPALPAELQYRIIGTSLVLWDHHANLIVDFLPGAFQATT